jgi:hypothetical protein
MHLYVFEQIIILCFLEERYFFQICQPLAKLYPHKRQMMFGLSKATVCFLYYFGNKMLTVPLFVLPINYCANLQLLLFTKQIQ